MRKLNVMFALTLVLLVIGFGSSQTYGAETKAAEIKPNVTIKLATTTSVDNSGLLKRILPEFLKDTGIGVDVIAVGTGQALQQARDGNVDIVIVHAPKAEEDFIKEGYGLERRYICENEFVIVGPGNDPGMTGKLTTAVDAFKAIAESKSKFISRGDDSGTHKMEKSVWEKAGIKPVGDWYIEAGQGMGAVLTMADEMNGYTLTDTGTYYSMIDKLDLIVLLKGDPLLKNIYSVLPLNPQKLPNIKQAEAQKFADWLVSPKAKKLIVEFKVNGYQLFEIMEPEKKQVKSL